MISAPVRDLMAARIAARLRPPPAPPRLLAWSSTLIFRKGSRTFPYRPQRHPAQWFWLFALDRIFAREWPHRRAVNVKPVQDGGTMTGQSIPQIYAAGVLGDPVVAGLPDMNLAGKQWREKTRPLIVDSRLSAWLPREGPGSEGNSSPQSVQLNGTVLTYMGAGAAESSESAQAMVTARVLCRDELDGIPPWGAELMKGRLAAYADTSLIIDTSTIKHDSVDESPILSAYQEGTKAEIEHRCAGCGTFVAWRWSHVDVDLTSETTADASPHLVCPSCGHRHDEAARRTHLLDLDRARLAGPGWHMARDGIVHGALPDTLTWSQLWRAVDSPVKTLGELGRDYWLALHAVKVRGDHRGLRSFHRDRDCTVYRGDSEGDDVGIARITRALLVARANSQETFRLVHNERADDGDSLHVAGDAQGADFLLATCDVQRGGTRSPPRAYFLVQGMDGAQRTWDLAWGHVVFCEPGRQASQAEVHSGLDRTAALIEQLAQRFARPLVRRGLDVGDQVDTLRLWLVRRRDWWALKGASRDVKIGTPGDDLAGWIASSEQSDRAGPFVLWLVATDEPQRFAQNGFLVPAGQPGAAHLPAGIEGTSSIVRHYCSTAEIPDGRGGVRWSDKERDRAQHPEYQVRNDLLDCRRYAVALGRQYLHTLNRPARRTVDAGAWFGRR